MNNFWKAAGVISAAIFLVTLATVGAAMFTSRDRVSSFNVQSATSCVSGIVYFVDKRANQVITPLIDASTDKPKHCS